MTPYVSTETAGHISDKRPDFIFVITKEVHFGSDSGFYILTSNGKLLTTAVNEPELQFVEDDCTNQTIDAEEEGRTHCKFALWQLEKDGR